MTGRRGAARVLAFVVGLAVVAASCSGTDEPTAEERAAIGRLVDAELTLDEQRCILEGLRDLEIGADQIVADDLTVDEDGDVLALSLECVDDLASVEAFVDSFIEGAAEAGTELTRDEARCAIRALGEAGSDDAAILACLNAADAPLSEGDDPVLDLLVEQCRRGNNQACDVLFADAPAGSDYETYGRTCGNRLPDGPGLTCFDTLG